MHNAKDKYLHTGGANYKIPQMYLCMYTNQYIYVNVCPVIKTCMHVHGTCKHVLATGGRVSQKNYTTPKTKAF